MLRMTCGLHPPKNRQQNPENGVWPIIELFLAFVQWRFVLLTDVDNSFARSYNAAEEPTFGLRKDAYDIS